MSAFIDLRVAVVAVTFVLASAGLIGLTVWFWRNATLESPVLAPLEVMSERRFRRANEEDRAVMLDSVRSLAAERPMPTDPGPGGEWLGGGISRVADGYFGDDEAEVDEEDAVAESSRVVIDPLLGGRGN